MYSKVIAKKSNSLKNPALGFITPVFVVEDTTGKYIPATKNMFPDGGEIFIYSGYNNLDQAFQNNELFEIGDISKSNDTSKSCQYSATGNSYDVLPATRLIPIIDSKFDIDNKALKDFREISYNSFFFIRSNDSIYGPLAMDYENNWRPINIDDERFNYIDEHLFSHIQDNHDCVFQFKTDNLDDYIIGDYVLDLNHLLEITKYTTIYAGTKEDTIAWARTKLPSALAISKVESDFLKKLPTIPFPNVSLPSERQKFDAFSRYIEEANDVINGSLPTLFDRYMETKSGKENLNGYLSENASAFFEQYRKDEFIAADKDLELKRDQIYALQLELENMKQNVDENSEKILEGIDETDKALLRQIIKNEEERKKFLSIFKANESLSDIQVSVQRLEGQRQILESDVQRRQAEVNKLEEKEKAVKAAIVNVKDKFFKEDEFATRLVETKIYSDILNNIEPVSLQDKEYELQVESKPVTLYTGNLEAAEFISEITQRLSTLNRTIDPNDVVNYLVSLNQNFLTIFAGAPGVGKTSLVTKLAQAIGSYYFDRFLSVPVQKGWTSNKDLIGYYNPITRRYQSSKTGLYQLLKLLDKDVKNGQEYPSIILLDEANLSPIEHYWAEFSFIADDDSKKIIKITDQDSVPISKGMRFVATINYDHTTEVLSERLISRAPIIKLAKSDLGLPDESVFEGVMSMFEYAKLDQWLKPQKESYKLDVKNRFESIIRKLEEEDPNLGIPIIVSARKQRAVEKYCASATPLMKSNLPLIALDYAVNQHILPLISGRGDAYKRRLIALQEKLANMPLSLKHLEKILHAGDNNFKYYKFFY